MSDEGRLDERDSSKSEVKGLQREMMKSGRRTVRELALKALYQKEFQPSFDGDSRLTGNDFSRDQKKFYFEILNGLKIRQKSVDRIIQTHSENWKLDRMALIDLNILRIAVFEMLYQPNVPKKAALNEALELAKAFGDQKSPAFINGILDRVLESLQNGADSNKKTDP